MRFRPRGGITTTLLAMKVSIYPNQLPRNSYPGLHKSPCAALEELYLPPLILLLHPLLLPATIIRSIYKSCYFNSLPLPPTTTLGQSNQLKLVSARSTSTATTVHRLKLINADKGHFIKCIESWGAGRGHSAENNTCPP